MSTLSLGLLRAKPTEKAKNNVECVLFLYWTCVHSVLISSASYCLHFLRLALFVLTDFNKPNRGENPINLC